MEWTQRVSMIFPIEAAKRLVFNSQNRYTILQVLVKRMLRLWASGLLIALIQYPLRWEAMDEKPLAGID